jgi:hypothetical protein
MKPHPNHVAVKLEALEVPEVSDRRRHVHQLRPKVDKLVPNLRTTSSLKCEAVPRTARIEGPWTCVSLNSRLESNKEEEDSFTSCAKKLTNQYQHRQLLTIAVRRSPTAHTSTRKGRSNLL